MGKEWIPRRPDVDPDEFDKECAIFETEVRREAARLVRAGLFSPAEAIRAAEISVMDQRRSLANITSGAS